MTKLDNYIYYTVCEYSLRWYRNSLFSTHSGFCSHVKSRLEVGDMSKKNKHILNRLIEIVDKIYGLGYMKSSEYVFDFFLLEKNKAFEGAVLLLNEMLGKSID